jgi:Ca-activated chloride channel family protein
VELAAGPDSVCPLTLNHSVLLQKVNELKPKADLSAGTNIGDAIAEALLRLDAAKANTRKIIVLLSDGQHIQSQDGPDAMRRMARPRESAQLAANLRYPIYAIDCGGILPADANPDAIAEREAGKQTMKSVAALTGGEAFTANNGAEFLAACKKISENPKNTVQSFQYRRYFDFFHWFAAAALAFLCTAHLLDRSRWLVVP